MDYFMSSDEYHNALYKNENRIYENRLNKNRINETFINKNGNGVQNGYNDNGQSVFREQLIR
jgi:hypothetical protein